jgi:hypothetical protein
MRNGKWRFSCAEAVEDETSLWKGEEKAVKIPGRGFAPMTRIDLFHPRILSSCFYVTENKSTAEAVL